MGRPLPERRSRRPRMDPADRGAVGQHARQRRRTVAPVHRGRDRERRQSSQGIPAGAARSGRRNDLRPLSAHRRGDPRRIQTISRHHHQSGGQSRLHLGEQPRRHDRNRRRLREAAGRRLVHRRIRRQGRLQAHLYEGVVERSRIDADRGPRIYRRRLLRLRPCSP